MKNILIFAIAISSTFSLLAQNSNEMKSDSITSVKAKPDPSAILNPVFTIVESMPQFPGGDSKMAEYIKTNLVYPAEAKKARIHGRLFVTFIVNEAGKITEPRILRGLGYGCDEEALRVMNAMPLWIPGEQNGKKVNVQYNLPIDFVL
jgi:periplasmic protein TonB